MPRSTKQRSSRLTKKYLAVYLPFICITMILIFAGIEIRTYRTQLKVLHRGLDELVKLQSGAITSALWEFNTDRLDALIADIEKIPHFQGVAVHDVLGEPIVVSGSLENADPDLVSEKSLIFQTDFVNEDLGKLTVAFNRQQIRNNQRDRLINDAIILVVLIVTLMVVTSLTTRWFIVQPLDKLRQHVLDLANGENVQLQEIHAKDEIGQLASSFATMQQKVVDRELALEHARETTFTELLESAPDAMIIVDQSGTILRFNSQIQKLFGFDLDEIRGMSVSELIPERLRAGHVNHLLRYFQNPTTRSMGVGMELLGARKDGTEFPIEIGLGPLHDPTGLMAVAAIRDISERILAEGNLRKLNQAVEQGSAIVFITDPTGRIEYVNPRFVEITGYSSDEAIGQFPSLLKSGHQPVSLYAELWKTLLDGSQWRGEFCNRKKDGTTFWASAALSPIRDKKGNITHFVAIEDDITFEKAAVEEIKEKEERFRTLVANLPETIYRCLHDESWTMKFMSDDIVELVGFCAEDFIDNKIRTYESVIHADDRTLVSEMVEKAFEADLPWIIEYRLMHADGSTRWVEERGRAIRNASTGEEYLDGVIADITSRKNMEKEVEDARLQAEAANRAKSDFLSHMSHELRTPLNGVLGYAQILQRDPDATENQKQSLEGIVNCGSHLLSLINDVLDLSKIEAGRIELDLAPSDLEHIVRSVIQIVEQKATSKGLWFKAEVSSEVPRGIVTDTPKLRQILVNLLGNAVKFTKTGGVTIQISESPRDRLCIRVIDTGVGMDAEELSAIFDPFKQVEAGKAAGGTGLGLAITERLIGKMGGSIRVESTKGSGSTFIVDLPLVESESEDLHALDSDSAQPQGQMVLGAGMHCTILIADDRETNRNILELLLHQARLTTLSVDDGDTALEMLRSHDEIDLVLMDIRMPRMTGIEAIKEIRADQSLKHLKVIAVTASVFPEFQQKAIEEGFDDFLCKPFRAEELFEKLNKHLDVDFVNQATAAANEPIDDLHHDHPDGEQSKQLAIKLREAIKLGNITALTQLAADTENTVGTMSASKRIRDLTRAFDFAGLERLADELDTHDNLDDLDNLKRG
jgi:PAS domain S-box-containing protein